MFRSRKAKTEDPATTHGDDMLVIVDRAVNPYLVMFHDPAGYRAEQVRALRNRLVTMNTDSEPKTLVVTSAGRSEGKSVTAINLAMALAELERQQVVLVDADLRRPSCERYLNLNPDIGLSDVLLGRAAVDRALRPFNFYGTVAVIEIRAFSGLGIGFSDAHSGLQAGQVALRAFAILGHVCCFAVFIFCLFCGVLLLNLTLAKFGITLGERLL
jgi:hypothetical protein